jgi:outer membrane murein-binding lipoprotein Lpp
MRVLTLPAVLVGVFAVSGWDEPSTAEMRSAVQATLNAQVQSVLDYVAETSGEEALARVRAARTDAFDVRALTKLDCTASADKPGHFCDFAVRVGVVTGELQATMRGRFYAGPRGLVFVNEDRAQSEGSPG